MDKAELIRHEIEKRRDHNLAIGNPLFAAMAEEDIELLCFIDSLQEESVSKDLEKELSYEDYMGFFNEYPDFPDDNWGFEEAWTFAKYFFKLGLKAQKGE